MSADQPGSQTDAAGSLRAGQILREAREAQGLTIERLASQLKVSAGKLEALESGQFEVFPDAAFLRALAMTLCRTLKVDAAPVLAMLPKARPVSLGASDPGSVPFHESKGRLRLNLESGVKSGRSLGDVFSPQWLAPLGLLAAAAVIWAWPRDVHWPESTPAPAIPVASTPALPASEEAAGTPLGQIQMVPEAADAASAASSVASLPVAMPSATALVIPAVVAQKAASVPAAAASLPVVAATPTAASVPLAPITRPARAEFSASSPSWIEVKDARGVRLLFRTVNAGESLALEGQAPLSVRLGNAQGTTVRFKGQAVDLAPVTQGNVARLELQ